MNKYKLIIYSLISIAALALVLIIDNSQNSQSPSSDEKNATQQLFDPSLPRTGIPLNWTSIAPKSSMRFKEYKIINSKGDFNLIVFKNIGGSTEQNISRWTNQFSGDQNSLMPLETREINKDDKNFIFIQTSGNFNGGMGQSKAFSNAGLIGFIIESSSDVYYFKAVADVSTLLESKEEVISTILSLKL